jgi:tRNA A37 threonylcarbamoyladenosine synthetase subunit TsaC/SUA5/YrdC
VDPRIRRAADIELDAGVLPGTPSTVVDLSRYEASGTHEVLREGALSEAEVAARLGA